MRQMAVEISVGGMSCASCVASLEGALGRVPGVLAVNINLATERATITYDADVTTLHALIEAVEDAGLSGADRDGDLADSGDDLRRLRQYRGARPAQSQRHALGHGQSGHGAWHRHLSAVGDQHAGAAGGN